VPPGLGRTPTLRRPRRFRATGPSFVRARAGLSARPPLVAAELYEGPPRARHGLVVIGSHVSLTTRQLDGLRRRGGIREIELDVARLLDAALRDANVRSVADRATRALDAAEVVVRTTRRVVPGADAALSLAIARHVSAALVDVVRAVTAARTPRFVVAKGGITSSDVATEGLGIRRAWMRGTLLPGIVSVWSAVDGAAPGMPYVVFAGTSATTGPSPRSSTCCARRHDAAPRHRPPCQAVGRGTATACFRPIGLDTGRPLRGLGRVVGGGPGDTGPHPPPRSAPHAGPDLQTPSGRPLPY